MERLTASRAHAIGESLRKVDPATADVLIAHGEWLKQAEGTLREANIQLAAPNIRSATATALRDRIDALLDIVPRAHPVNQSDDE